MGMSTVAFKSTVALSLQCSNNLTGADYVPNSNNTAINKSISLGTSAANAAAGGADEEYSTILSISSSSSTSVDVTSITDLLGTTAVNLARVKHITVRLLNATDDSTLGTAASSITIDGTVANALLSSTNSGWLANATSKFDVANGDYVSWGTTKAAGIVVSGTNKIIKIVNNDAGLTAKVQLTVIGGST